MKLVSPKLLKGLVIRHSQTEDAAGLQHLYSQRHAYADTLQLPLPSLEGWQNKLHTQPGTYSLVALRDSALLGQISLTAASSVRRRHVAAIGMAVHEENLETGVGTALLRAAIDLAENWLAITRIELEVFTQNKAAIALYKKMGFVREGTCRAYAFRDGVYADVDLMARINLPRAKSKS